MELSLNGFGWRDRIGAVQQAAAIAGMSVAGADFVWGHVPQSIGSAGVVTRSALALPVCDAGIRIHGIRAGPSCKARLSFPGPAYTARPASGLAGFFLPAAQARGRTRLLNPLIALTTPA